MNRSSSRALPADRDGWRPAEEAEATLDHASEHVPVKVLDDVTLDLLDVPVVVTVTAIDERRRTRPLRVAAFVGDALGIRQSSASALDRRARKRKSLRPG